MNKHLHCLSYIVRHKWFVFVAGRKTGTSLWRLLRHDWSKVLPSEWFAYADYFYSKGSKVEFDRAWLRHIHRQDHHWNHWVLRVDIGAVKCLEMPESAWREMVADWMGAGRAIHGRWEAFEWYSKNSNNIQLHYVTRFKVEKLLLEMRVLGMA